jgi:hypothetical protein
VTNSGQNRSTFYEPKAARGGSLSWPGSKHVYYPVQNIARFMLSVRQGLGEFG